MKALKITLISLASVGAVFGVLVFVAKYNTLKLVSKQGKKFIFLYKGKKMVVDAQELHNKKMETNFGKWSLVPLYSNESDKANSLAGLRLEDSKTVGYGNFYF